MTDRNHRQAALRELACKAFTTSFPDLAEMAPFKPFYICPECLRGFGMSARLTRAHAPPRAIGGHRVILTCHDCDSRAGHALDVHLKKEADVFGFFQGDLQEIKAELETSSGAVPIRLSAEAQAMRMAVVPEAAAPQSYQHVLKEFSNATVGTNWQDFQFKVTLGSFSLKGASTGWLRTAYLVFFATLGYRFILRPEMNVVRAKIRNPELETPATFRIILNEPVAAPALIRIEEPEVFRSYGMLYERNAVFLPRYNDHSLYDRLAQHPDTRVVFRGKHYPWPSGSPTFFHDLPPANAAEVERLFSAEQKRMGATTA